MVSPQKFSLKKSTFHILSTQEGFILSVWCCSISSPRRHHSVCCLGGYIYIIGGFGRHRVIMDSVEKYHMGSSKYYFATKRIALMCPFKDQWMGWDSIVGIETRYRPDSLGILVEQDLTHLSRPAL